MISYNTPMISYTPTTPQNVDDVLESHKTLSKVMIPYKTLEKGQVFNIIFPPSSACPSHSKAMTRYLGVREKFKGRPRSCIYT